MDLLKMIALSLLASTSAFATPKIKYKNKIQKMAPPAAYTEVCFKDGETHVDFHSSSESTEGGHCNPGDAGFIIEKYPRDERPWSLALQECLEHGMRLPTPLEWQLTCHRSERWLIAGMGSSWEWASNKAFPLFELNERSISVEVFGKSGCDSGKSHIIGYPKGYLSILPFRCVR